MICTPAAAPVCRTANATTGVGQRLRQQRDGKALGGKDFGGRDGELCGSVPGVVADEHVRPAQATSLSTRATAHVARSTTATFMPVGPARIGPRSPAVPNVSDPLNRAGELVGVKGRQLGRGTGIRIVGDPLLGRHRSPLRSR